MVYDLLIKPIKRKIRRRKSPTKNQNINYWQTTTTATNPSTNHTTKQQKHTSKNQNKQELRRPQIKQK